MDFFLCLVDKTHSPDIKLTHFLEFQLSSPYNLVTALRLFSTDNCMPSGF